MQSLLPLEQLGLLGVEAFRNCSEFGTEIRAQLQPNAVVTVTGAIDVTLDGGSCETSIDHGFNLRDAKDILLVVVPVPTAASVRNEQAALLVVAQGARAGPSLAGEFTDLHCCLLLQDLTLTLVSGRTLSFMTTSTTFQNAFIFHGYAAMPDDHWFGWLAQQLDSANMRTVVPALPDSLAPDASRWQEAVRESAGEAGSRTAIVAHSLGCLAVLRHLASLTGEWRLGALVMISGFLDPLPALPALDEFIGDGCDVTGLSEHVDRIFVIRSDDDSLVPPSHTDRLAARLGTGAEVIPGAGHFLAADGHITLPAAYNALVS